MIKILAILSLTVSFGFSQSLQSMTWLTGEWHAETAKFHFIEKWQQASPQTFEAISITKSAEDTVSTESLRLVEMLDEIFLIPYVKSNPLPVAFKLVSDKPDSLVFYNSSHDFPNRISYISKSKKEFHAVVEGKENKGFVLVFKKQK